MEFKIKLLGKRPEAKDTKTFIFERPRGFSYLAGQYVYLTLPRLDQPDERGDTRHFTLSSSPTEAHLAITVRMRARSGYKQTLDKYALGTQISMRGPNGFFILESDHTTTPQIMIAGGIGITPYRSILKYVADEAPASLRSGYLLPSLRRERNPSEAENTSHSSTNLWFDFAHHPEPVEGRSWFSAKGDKNLPVPIQLLHSNSTPEEIVFRKELDNIQQRTYGLFT